MRVSQLKNILKMLPDDTEVYIQTVPDDFAQPLQERNISLWPATPDKIQDSIIGINREKLVLISFFPEKSS